MRVLHFYKTFYPDTLGGVEQAILCLAEGMAPEGVQTHVLTLSKNPHQANFFSACQVHRVQQHFELASTSFSTAAFSKFQQLLKEVDLVHYHFPYPFMDLVHCMSKISCPTVVTYHSDIVKQKHLLKLYRPLMQRFLRSVDAIVATSPNYVATSPVLQRFKDKTHVIPMGLPDNKQILNQPERINDWRKKLPERFFLFVGVLRYYKGLHVLLDALALTSYPMVIVGSGPEELALKAQAKRLNLENIYFLGSLDDQDKHILLSLCYAFIFPSHLRSEAFGLSLLEAAMHAKAMISCEIGTGTTFINLNKQTGINVPPANPQALSKALHVCWQHPETVLQYGHHARARYESQFTSTQMIQRYLNLYKNLLK